MDENATVTPVRRNDQYDAGQLDSMATQAEVGDYWSAPPPPERFYFPDGVTYVEFMRLTHGMRTEYSRRTNREMTIERQSGNAKMKTDLMGDTNILLEIAIIGWNVTRGGQAVTFSKGTPGSNLNQFLAQADPMLVDDIERAVREKNKWLIGTESTVEELEQQIEDLHKELQEAKAREAAKNS